MAIEPAEQYDPFLKKNVFGNILDQVDNYQYNLKLYMIPPVGQPVGTQASADDQGGSTDARADKPSNAKNSSGQGGYLQNSLTASPAETIILAQTGVTGTQIDNLEIESVVGPGGGVENARVNFDIIQPGAADFLDQMVAAKAYLGDQITAQDVPIFLEINFKGYAGDIDDEDNGGDPILVAGPYRYMLKISNVTLEIDEAGSTYQFSTVPVDQLAYIDTNFRMPKKLESIGTTIEEHVEDLVAKIREHNETNNDKYSIQDEITIDLSGLTEGERGLKDTKLTNTEDSRAEEINRIMNPELEGKTEDEYEDILKDATKDEGTLDIVVSENKVTVREGVSFERYIATLLSMNDEFFARCTRSIKADDPANNEVRKDQAFIEWFKLNAYVKYAAFDYKRNAYAMETVFKPTLFKTAKNTVQADPAENSGLTGDDVRARVDGLPIFKAYHYLYTGLNDQIKQCRIDYKSGIAILTAPAGGVSGDFSTVLAKTLSNSATPDEDLSGNDLATAAVKAANEEDRSKAIDSMFSKKNSSPDREKDIAGVGRILKLSDAEIKDAIENRNGANANRIKETLKNKGAAQAIRNAQINAARTPDDRKNPDTTNYTPSLSGYTYSADIIGSVSDRLDQAAALTASQELAESLKPKEEEDANADASGPQESIVVASVPNPAEDATYNGTPRNTVFGYLMQQHAIDDFLVTLDMEIKGDPWWLGPASADNQPEKKGSEFVEDKTDEKSIRTAGDENYVLFDLQTPRLYDFDVDDEDSDSNSGYWSKMGTSYFITGVYQVRGVNHMFSGGEFSQEVSMIRQTAIDLKKTEKGAE
jgi:hypothetical protein